MSRTKTKQEMAEWLAENVLEGEFYPQNVAGKSVLWKIKERFLKPSQLVPFIYSPDGFFAVLDAMERRFEETYFCLNINSTMASFIFMDGVAKTSSKVGHGKDRYEAFYNAVYEAMK